MKKLAFGFLTLMVTFATGTVAQCVSTLQYFSHDTTVTGGGNSIYNFTFPKFAAAAGTLVEVRIRSEVTLSFGFVLENNGGANVSGYRVRVDRNDLITSDAMPMPVDTTFPRKTYGPISLAPSDGNPHSGFDYYVQAPNYILNHSAIQRSLYNTAEFLGAGNVSFEYSANSYTSSPVSPPVSINSADTINFSITYVVCPTWFLASDISFFSAKKKDDLHVDLEWVTYNETEGRKYTLEKSFDGQKFQAVQQFHALPSANQTGIYRYQYTIEPEEQSKIIFRLKQVERAGDTKYSALRVVDGKSKVMTETKLYPNPGTGEFNILFSNKKRADWKIDVMSLNGQLLQRFNFRNTLFARIDLRGKLPKGHYILKSTELGGQQRSIQKIVIQ